MQTLYVSDLPLPGQVAHAWDAAEATIGTWLTGRLGLEVPDDASTVTNPDLGTVGRRRTLVGDDGSRLTLWQTRRVDPAHPLWAYDVSLWLADDRSLDEPQAQVRVRLSAHALHGWVAEMPHLPAAPAVVRSLLADHHVTADGYRLGHPRAVGTDDIEQLAAHLTDPRRRLPVLVITTPGAGERPIIDPSAAAHRLAGLAHVVVLSDHAATRQLPDSIGAPQLGVHSGAARLYWPGLHPGARRSDHPLWLPDRLTGTGTARFAGQLFARLGRLSALTIGQHALDERLHAQARRHATIETDRRLEKLAGQHADTLRQLEEARAAVAAAEQVTPAAESTEGDWFGDYERTLQEHEQVVDELEQVASERDDLQEEVDRLLAQRKVDQENLAAMAKATATTQRRTSPEEDEDITTGDETPTTVLRAVEIAAATCERLVFLPEAFDSAEASGFRDAQRVLDDLCALEAVAAAWQADELVSVEDALIANGVTGYRSGISRTARTQYASDYERQHDGRTIVLGPHIARGVGAPTTILRIYWYQDTETRTLVIGHVGRKLRDDSNR